MTTDTRTLAELEAARQAAIDAGHAATTVKAMLTASREGVRIEALIKDRLTESQHGAVVSATNGVEAALKNVKVGTLLRDAGLKVAFQRDDTGVLVMGRVSITVPDLVTAALYAAVPLADFEALESVDSFSVEMSTEGVEVKVGGKRATGNSVNTGERGWTDQNGAPKRLQDILETFTAEQKAAFDALNGDGNKTYDMKKKAAKKAGWHEN
jgi:phage terminase small subunit